MSDSADLKKQLEAAIASYHKSIENVCASEGIKRLNKVGGPAPVQFE